MGKISNIEEIEISRLIPYINNAKKHGDEQINKIAASIREFGFLSPCLIDKDYNIIAGHGRIEAAKRLDMKAVPCLFVEGLSEAQRKAYILADNRLTELSDWDMDLVNLELESLQELDFDISLTGFDLEYGIEEQHADNGKLSDRFLIPPFDIFNARGGEWVERKRYWNSIIQDKAQARSEAASNMTNTEKYGKTFTSDVSILDPVLSEIAVKWFCPPDGKCFDCFAGDTVFGYVSAYLGHEFKGIELRQEQVDFNNSAVDGLPAEYICDDGRNVAKHIKAKSQDLLFSCPPYYDLEVYSDLENDASNQGTYEEFYEILETAFTNAAKCLKDNRFAVIVVGDIRDKKTGGYYNFPNDIINTFRRNGFVLYNNIKILTPIGTAAIRASKYMEYRKVAHVYQDVLVFYKGEQKEIKNIFPSVEVENVSEDMEF
jgi:hypothetical protein